jgi:ABC-2 type transport system ATP-binding protein
VSVLEPIIKVRDLTKVFVSRGQKITAVDNISFDVFDGEIFGMIGPNGAGKSTTFSMLTTLIKPTSGSIKVAGFDVYT